MGETTNFESARLFAAHAHAGQTRKLGEPYITHLDETANIVTRFTDDEEIRCAALLHDIKEDQPQCVNAMESIFSARICRMVDDLTRLNQGQKGSKQAYRVKLLNAAWDSQIVKFADISSNVPSILFNMPDYAPVYIREKLDTLELIYTDTQALQLSEVQWKQWYPAYKFCYTIVEACHFAVHINNSYLTKAHADVMEKGLDK